MEGLHTGIKTYQLRIGRMTDAQRRNYTELSSKWCIPYTSNKGIDESDRADGGEGVQRGDAADGIGAQRGDGTGGGEGVQAGLAAIFGNDNPVTVEIGFGMGAATAIIAKEHPENNYIGIEVHKPGIGRLMGLIEEKHLNNIRIIEHDALEALEDMFCCGSVEAFHIFFPDPWPKKRHNKRRLITRPRTDLIASRLATGGYLYMVTDWEDYAQWALRELTATEGLVNKYDGFAPRQTWRPDTKFETRGTNQGRGIRELYFVKE